MSSETDTQDSPPRRIAIDGPVASGKSAVGSTVARRLGYRFVDTGTMYRAFAWLATKRKIDPADEKSLAALAEATSLALEPASKGAAVLGRVRIDGFRPTANDLRATERDGVLSLVSRVPGVRKAMVTRQRELANEGGIVMAGRDIGTVVLPDAPLKVYLDASPEERVRRRHEELAGSKGEMSPEQVRDEVAFRDAVDREREASPLRPAANAVIIDTDHLSLEQVVDRILELASCR